MSIVTRKILVEGSSFVTPVAVVAVVESIASVGFVVLSSSSSAAE